MKETLDLKKKAQRYLKRAKILLEDGDYDSSVSQSYYAMYFMVEAIFLIKNIKVTSHKGIISQFGQQFVKTNEMTREIGRMLREAFEARQLGDYEIGIGISKEEAELRLENAKIFIRTLEEYLKKRSDNES